VILIAPPLHRDQVLVALTLLAARAEGRFQTGLLWRVGATENLHRNVCLATRCACRASATARRRFWRFWRCGGGDRRRLFGPSCRMRACADLPGGPLHRPLLFRLRGARLLSPSFFPSCHVNLRIVLCKISAHRRKSPQHHPEPRVPYAALIS